MATKDIVAYIESNQKRFPLETLLAELRKSGYSEAEVQEALRAFQAQGATPDPKNDASLDRILKRMESLEGRLTLLEQRRAAPTPETTVTPAPPLYRQDADISTEGRNVSRRRSEATEDASISSRISDERVSAHSFLKKDIESYIGKWVFGVIGIVAVLFGAGFFLKFIFERNLVGPVAKVVIELAAGLTFVLVGEWVRKHFAKYSYLLSGAGIALFYLAMYGAFHWYQLIGQTTAFAFMTVITAFGMALAIRVNGLELALLATSGGFLTPYLLSTGTARDVSFFGYLAVISLGVLGVAFFRKWQALTLLGFTGFIINFISWHAFFYEPEKLFFTMSVLGVFYAIYLLTGIAQNTATKETSNVGDLFILTINPAWFFGWSYFLLKPDYEFSLGFLAAGLAALYIGLAYLASLLRAEDGRAKLFLGAIALIFLTIAVPLQLEQNAITIAWAAEAAVLFVLGLALKHEGMRMFGLGVLVVAVIRLVGFDSKAGDLATFSAFFNRRFFTYFMTILAASIMGYTATKKSSEFTPREKGAQPFIWSVVNVLILVAMTLEIYTFFEVRKFHLNKRPPATQSARLAVVPVSERNLPYTPPDYFVENAEFTAYRTIENQRNAAISVFWTLYAVFLITLGILRRNTFLRWSAVSLFTLTIGKVFILDLAALKTPYRIISFTVLGLILLVASYLYFRYEKGLKEPNPS